MRRAFLAVTVAALVGCAAVLVPPIARGVNDWSRGAATHLAPGLLTEAVEVDPVSRTVVERMGCFTTWWQRVEYRLYNFGVSAISGLKGPQHGSYLGDFPQPSGLREVPHSWTAIRPEDATTLALPRSNDTRAARIIEDCIDAGGYEFCTTRWRGDADVIAVAPQGRFVPPHQASTAPTTPQLAFVVVDGATGNLVAYYPGVGCGTY